MHIRAILAENMRKYRKKARLSQASLAGNINTTTQYIAMIELQRKFPSAEMIERIAKGLHIESYQLFEFEPKLDLIMEHIEYTIENNIKKHLNNVLPDQLYIKVGT